MNADFADWYRAVSIEPKADELQQRWRGVEAFTKDTNQSDLPFLTALFFRMSVTDESFLARFRAAFKQVDETFPMQRNDAELQVLAGATLVKHFDYGDGWGLAAALQLVCASFGGSRQPVIPGIVDAARSHLHQLSAEIRTPTATASPLVPDLTAHIASIKAVCQTNSLPSLASPLASLGEAVGKALTEVTNWAESVDTKQTLFREESDVLWWLVGGHSRDRNAPFETLKEPSGCLIAAKELADLVRVLPGPFAAEAFLDNVLHQAHPRMGDRITLAAAVDACPSDWRSRFVEAAMPGLDALCPVHLAVRKSIDGKGWATAFHRSSRLKASEPLTPRSLSVQTYQEILLSRALRILEKNDNA